MEEQNKKVKKNKANALQEFGHSADSMHMKVKDKKRMKNKKGEIRNDIQSTLIQTDDINVKDGADKKVRKKDKKISNDVEAVEIKVVSNEKTEVGEGKRGGKIDDEKDFECNSRLEARKDRKKRHKKNQEKDRLDSFSSLVELCADKKLQSGETVKERSCSEKRDDIAEINSGEEGSRKQKNKKAKNDNEVSNVEAMESVTDDEKLRTGRKHNDKNTVENDAKKVRKKDKRISKDGEAVEIKVVSNEKAEVGEGNRGEQIDDGKKRHKKNQEKNGIDSFSSLVEICADKNVESDETVKERSHSGKRDSAEIKSGEEGCPKEKKKKAKNDNEISNMEGIGSVVDEEKLGKTRECNDENTVENDAKKVKKKRKKMDREIEVCVTEMEGEKKEKRKKRKSVKDGLEETVNGMEEGGKHKKRAKSVNDSSEGIDDKGASDTKMSVSTASLSDNPKSKGTPKKVRFSTHVEVFPSSDGQPIPKKTKHGKDLVQGKRFTPDEDEMIEAAVLNYIDQHGLGEDGLEKVLHCKDHPEAKHCWREIALALPWRPRLAIYYRAHILFKRGEKRAWTPEEYEMVRRFHEQYGSDWTMLADALGKHRFHVKDTWRRIKLPNAKKGRWSQDEYQALFDLVNMDLQMKAFEEKKSKHGMLRDNICWGAISDKLATRITTSCCLKWYNQLTSPMVAEGKWADTDDFRLVDALFSLDACCMEDVDWDNLLEHRSGDICRKRWTQMVKHIGEHGNKSFAEQVEVLLQRYCPDLLEAREEFANRPAVDEVE